MIRRFVLAIFFLTCWGISFSLQAKPDTFPSHPRGLIMLADVSALKERLRRPPLYDRFIAFQKHLAEKEQALSKEKELNNYDRAYLAVDLAGMFVLTGEMTWAEKAYQHLELLIEDPYFTDPFSRGLTRATLLQHVAIAYDFCYNGWTKEQRTKVNDAIFDCMFSVNANMGYSANYSIESNWMGVRFGAVILAACVWDDPMEGKDHRSRALPLIWDATKRLKEHLEKNIYSNGWNGESLGYHNYDWSFVGPALVVLRNRSIDNPAFLIEQFAPNALNSLQAQMISTVSIPASSQAMTKIDLSDDNMNASLGKLLSLASRLYPEEQQAEIAWMQDYLTPDSGYFDTRNSLLYSLLFPTTASRFSPPSNFTYYDPDQGIVIFRNQYQNEEDIVAAYSATAKRIKGHQGPDTNAPRLIGLGASWIIGGGRTGEVAGQSNLFPSAEETPTKNTRKLGKLLEHAISDFGGYAIGEGSCVGVEQHRRFFLADFYSASEAEAVLILSDSSNNGKRLRICTPEYNQATILKDGYLLTAPNGATMQVKVVGNRTPVVVEESLVRYGGSTTRHNPGIHYRGEQYENSRAMDLQCEKHITVVITLQRKDVAHPVIEFTTANRQIQVGKAFFQLK